MLLFSFQIVRSVLLPRPNQFLEVVLASDGPVCAVLLSERHLEWGNSQEENNDRKLKVHPWRVREPTVTTSWPDRGFIVTRHIVEEQYSYTSIAQYDRTTAVVDTTHNELFLVVHDGVRGQHSAPCILIRQMANNLEVESAAQWYPRIARK